MTKHKPKTGTIDVSKLDAASRLALAQFEDAEHQLADRQAHNAKHRHKRPLGQSGEPGSLWNLDLGARDMLERTPKSGLFYAAAVIIMLVIATFTMTSIRP